MDSKTKYGCVSCVVADGLLDWSGILPWWLAVAPLFMPTEDKTCGHVENGYASAKYKCLDLSILPQDKWFRSSELRPLVTLVSPAGRESIMSHGEDVRMQLPRNVKLFTVLLRNSNQL